MFIVYYTYLSKLMSIRPFSTITTSLWTDLNSFILILPLYLILLPLNFISHFISFHSLCSFHFITFNLTFALIYPHVYINFLCLSKTIIKPTNLYVLSLSLSLLYQYITLLLILCITKHHQFIYYYQSYFIYYLYIINISLFYPSL
jgi:hypothetical protein